MDHPRVGPLIGGGGAISGITSSPGGLTGPAVSTTTTGVGKGYTNQPANDAITVVSDDFGDNNQVVTIIGTTNGVDTVVLGTTTLDGLNARDSSVAGHFNINGIPGTKNDWGQILAAKLSAPCTGTITIAEKSGGLTIATIAPAILSSGVETVTAANQSAYGRLLVLYSDGATTKQLGLQGTNTSGVVAYDSQALTGTTKATSNSAFNTVTEIYTGDLEVARTATVETVGGVYLDGKPSVKNLGVTSIDNELARFDGTTGEVIQGNGAFSISDAGELLGDLGGSGAGSAWFSGLRINKKNEVVPGSSDANNPNFALVAGSTADGNGYIGLAQGKHLKFSANHNAENALDAGLGRADVGALKVTDGSTGYGYLRQAGNLRVTGDVPCTNSTAFIDATGLSVTVVAGRTYQFRAVLFFTTVNTSGVKVQLTGAATHTNIIADFLFYNVSAAPPALLNTTSTRTTAKDTPIGVTASGTAVQVVIEGTTTINAGGAFTIQFAQNAETGAAESVTCRRGSTFTLTDLV